MPRGEASTKRQKVRTAFHLFNRELLESTDLSLSNGEFIADFVGRGVSCELFCRNDWYAFGDSRKSQVRSRKVLRKEQRLLLNKVATKQLGIIPIRPICAFRPFVTSWLDIELPEG